MRGILRMIGGGGTVANPVWDGLQGYWNADNNPNDSKGTYNGTLVNGAGYGIGKINEGFELDGVSQHLTTGVRLGFSNTDTHTYSVWAKIDEIKNRGLVTNCDLTIGSSLGIWNSGKLTLLKGSVQAQSYGTTTLTTGTFYHLAITHDVFDGVTANVKFYVNGVADGANIFDIGVSVTPRTQIIGSALTLPSYFNGTLDEIGIWDRVLTPTEITELYNSGAGLQY